MESKIKIHVTFYKKVEMQLVAFYYVAQFCNMQLYNVPQHCSWLYNTLQTEAQSLRSRTMNQTASSADWRKRSEQGKFLLPAEQLGHKSGKPNSRGP